MRHHNMGKVGNGHWAKYERQVKPSKSCSGVRNFMFGGYRLYFAAIGLTLAVPSYGAETKNSQTEFNRNTAAQLEQLATAIENQPVAAALDRGCHPGQDDRQSDLCAQWKAADAAAEAARWSWWMLWISGGGLLIGGGTLLAAWSAAHWAKKAATFTESAAIAARDQVDQSEEHANRQLRPYVLVDDFRFDIVNDSQDNLAGIGIYCRIRNFGQTPAFGVIIQTNALHWHGNALPPWWPFPDFPERWGPLDQKPNVIGPGQTIEILVASVNPTELDQVQKGWRRIFSWGWIRYTDLAGNPFHTTFSRRAKIVRSIAGPLCSAPYTQFYNCIDHECDMEVARREPLPDIVTNFFGEKGIVPQDPIFWSLWLDAQAVSTWERAADGTPYDPKPRDYYGVINPFLRAGYSQPNDG